MSALPQQQKLTVAEYLALEQKAAFRSEFFNGEMFAMAGSSPEHNEIKDNIIAELALQLRGSGCRTYSSDQRIKVDRTGLYTYPDIVIVCGKKEVDAIDPNSITNPRVVVEVLSPSTASYDRGTKFRHYQRVRSVQEVVLVSQDRVQVERYVRQTDESWLLTTFDDPTGDFSLESIGISVRLGEVYRDVAMPEAPLRATE